MAREDDPLNRGHESIAAHDRIRYEWMLSSIARFRLFFVGLVFSLLAFSVQFAIGSTEPLIRYAQIIAWIFLLITGVIALRDAGGYVKAYTENIFNGVSAFWRTTMWILFTFALVFLGGARAFSI